MARRKRTMKKRGGGGVNSILPITTWGQWSQLPGALAWSASTQAPSPIANGGLYTGPQSSGVWASQPFPATQYALAVEASRVSQIPDVFYHQRPNDNAGASFSPYVGTAYTAQHTSAVMGPKVGGKRRKSRKYVC